MSERIRDATVRERSSPCVCFDWGGVILRICRSWAEGCERAGVPLRDPSLGAKPFANERKGASEQFQLGRLQPRDFFTRISGVFGGMYTPAEVEAVHHAWLIEEYPGVDALVADLHAAGVPTAMLSNTNAAHWNRQSPAAYPHLPHFPTAGSLRHRHASHILGLAKPDPAIYAAFERETGFTPAEIIFFDDLADNIAAAKARGWRAHQIDHTADTAAQMRRHLMMMRVL